jgi:hypothetical protein
MDEQRLPAAPPATAPADQAGEIADDATYSTNTVTYARYIPAVIVKASGSQTFGEPTSDELEDRRALERAEWEGMGTASTYTRG